MKTMVQTKSGKIPPRELAFDIDGVIADTFRVFVEVAANQYGIPIEYEEITEYDYNKVVDIDEMTGREIIQRILDDPVGIGIQPVSGATEILNRLLRISPLLFVTARTEKNSIIDWMQQNIGFPDMNAVNLIATGSHEDKLPILMEYGIKYFVEDRLETCYLLDKASVTPIVFDQPWNRKPHPFIIAKTWDDIAEMIDWQPCNHSLKCNLKPA